MSLSDEQIQEFKEQLEEEQEELEQDLSMIGRINPDNPEDWEAVKADLNVMETDLNEVADTFEEFEENAAILNELEIRLREVKHALEKIEEGNYGICEVSGDEIPLERLEVNPAARTTVEHADEVEPLHSDK